MFMVPVALLQILDRCKPLFVVVGLDRPALQLDDASDFGAVGR
jgi:hypothetical protein